jgi:hypothetical protein
MSSLGTKGMKRSCVLLLLLLFFGCKRKEVAPAAPSPPPIRLDSAIRFSASQRSTTPLPGSERKLLITLGDITAGQVLVTLSWDDGRPVVATRSLHPNDIVTFTVSNHVYKLKLEKLTNVLIGEDTALFRLWPATAEAEDPLSEQDKIEALISSLRQLSSSGAKFIRNGQDHTVEEAIGHMRDKWEWKKFEIKTVEDFITIAGSASSISGDAYLIKLPDGTTLTSEEWFRKQLDLMKKLPEERVDVEKQ